MQVTGVKITVIGTGAAIVLALAFGNIEPLIAVVGRADVVLQKIPTAAWFFAPLLLTTIAWIVERFGLIQPLLSTLYKDLTDSQIPSGKHLSDKDKLRLTQMLERWKAPMPHLARADSVLAFWGGKERWSLEGFDRCWIAALIYPCAVLLVVWACSNNGQFGAATVISPVDDASRRWFALVTINALCVLMGAATYLFDKPEQLRRALRSLRLPMANRLSDAALRVGAGSVAITIALAGAVIFEGAGVFAAAFAVAFGLAYAFAVTHGVAAFVFSGAVPSAVVVSGAVIGAFVFPGNVGFALSGVLALPLMAAGLRLRQKFAASRWRRGTVVAISTLASLALFIATAALVPALPAWGLQLRKNGLTAAGIPFVLVVLLGLLPLINAVSDWVSLNATRAFISRMQAGATRGSVGRLYVYDVAIALVLTVLIYVAVVAVIWMMQRFGWQVDVKTVLVELRDNPWSGQSTWLLTLAVTNFIPTLVHVALWMFGSVQSRDADARAHIEQFLRDGGSSAPRQIAPTIVSMLRLQPWLERAMVVSLTLALIPLFAICVPWAADWLLQRL